MAIHYRSETGARAGYLSFDEVRKRPARIGSDKKRRYFAALRLRDGDRCHYCSQTMKPTQINTQPDPDTMTLEHVVPCAHGGVNAQTNLVLACHQCNNERGSQIFYCDCEFCLTAYELYYKE